jgi:hypothetical protein
MAIFPTRVVALPTDAPPSASRCSKHPTCSDELFETQHQSLKREFTNIEAAFAK